MSEISKEEASITERKWKTRKMIEQCDCRKQLSHACYLDSLGIANINPEWYKSRKCKCGCHVPCTCVFCAAEIRAKQRSKY